MRRIGYSQCWEDAHTLRQALRIGPTDDVVSIASAGDNTLALLLDSPRSIAAIDMNPVQLYLLELKLAALRSLDYRTFIQFLGARNCNRRIALYQSRLAPILGSAARAFWDQNQAAIDQGVIHCGKLEQFLALFRRLILPYIHSPATVDRLLEVRQPSAREELFENVWNTPRWRTLFRIIFSRAILGAIGRERNYYNQVDCSSTTSELLKRVRRGLTQIDPSTNYLLEYILTGSYRDLEAGPLYLREKNFRQLRTNSHRITLYHSDLAHFLWRAPSRRYSRFNISDILEYLTPSERGNLLHQMVRCSRSGSRVAFWTLFVPQVVPAYERHRIRPRNNLAAHLWQCDRGFFYGSLNVWGVYHPAGKPAAVASGNPNGLEVSCA